jgi:hypothetical protein
MIFISLQNGKGPLDPVLETALIHQSAKPLRSSADDTRRFEAVDARRSRMPNDVDQSPRLRARASPRVGSEVVAVCDFEGSVAPSMIVSGQIAVFPLQRPEMRKQGAVQGMSFSFWVFSIGLT